MKIGLLLILVSGAIAILSGVRFNNQQERTVADAAQLQHEQLKRHAESFKDEIGYMLYYARFAFVNERSPMEAFSIGQRDVNPTVLSLNIRNVEAQKYDSALGNPYNQLIGTIDMSFVLIFLFPCLIIALMYSLLSEEQESRRWSLLTIQAKRPSVFLLHAIGVRVVLVISVFVILMIAGGLFLSTGFTIDFWKYTVTGMLYILFWFAVCVMVISFQRSSNFNAQVLLCVYLFLLIVLPAGVNSFLENKYPVSESFDVNVRQRKAYHEKWDMDKGPTIEKFFARYPQFRNYTVDTVEFSWPLYYAMQLLGDEESKEQSLALVNKLKMRAAAAGRIAKLIPSLHVQLQLNNLAKSDLENHLRFLEAATTFHEKRRLHFYPKIFENQPSTSEDWSARKEEYFRDDTTVTWGELVTPLLMLIMLCAAISVWKLRTINDASRARLAV